MIDIQIDKEIRECWVGEAILAVCHVQGCNNALVSESGFNREVAELESDLQTKGKDVLQESGVQRMRATFRAMPDMDPTRYRPSSEALIRRFLEQGFFHINPIVDLNNLLSARLQIPLGIYDLDRVLGSRWTYRIGHAGETYQTFSQQPKNAAGKLVIADETGILGSPVADSGRASIRAQTTHIAVVAYLPLDASKAEGETAAAEIKSAFTKQSYAASATNQVIT